MADVVNNDHKENSKRFWSFVKSKRQESTGVAPLINKDGNLQSDSTKNSACTNYLNQEVPGIPRSMIWKSSLLNFLTYFQRFNLVFLYSI